jgi:hypothetical protein
MIQSLVGKVIFAKMAGKRKIVSGEVAQGKIKIDYICDQGLNAIGARQEKRIRLKEGDEFYMILKNNSGRITSAYRLHPGMSPCLEGVGVY